MIALSAFHFFPSFERFNKCRVHCRRMCHEFFVFLGEISGEEGWELGYLDEGGRGRTICLGETICFGETIVLMDVQSMIR